MDITYSTPQKEITIVKKSGVKQKWQPEKIALAINKSASRVAEELTKRDITDVIDLVVERIDQTGRDTYSVDEIHKFVEKALKRVNEEVGISYMDYRNFKKASSEMVQRVWESDQRSRYIGDYENANKDSTLVATQQALRRSAISKEFYTNFLAKKSWMEAHEKGFIYIHDLSDRIDTTNCCLARIGEILKGGFNMANVPYNEPKSLDVAFDVVADLVESMAAQQYGGFTLPQIDKWLSAYAEKSYKIHCNEFLEDIDKTQEELSSKEEARQKEIAIKRTEKELRQGWQGLELTLNTCGSSRGDYPFTTVTFGLATDFWGKKISEWGLRVHMKGQGEKDKERPMLFPKYVFLYDENIHGEGKVNEDLFNLAIECSKRTMYPDYLSLSGEGYISSMYKKYGEVISPMGCRAFLSPWWRRGGLHKADEADTPVFEGRFNIGVVSLNLPLIYLYAENEGKDFYKVLDYYLEIIRDIHKYTYEYLGARPASINPLGFCEGGFYLPGEENGHNGLNPDDKIAPFLKAATASFGITALNELQEAYNHKSLVEDGEFALEVIRHINDKVNEFKEEDGRLYAIYGTPAESLCGTQAQQVKEMFGIIPGVSDRDYVSNSFHCHVSEDISPIEKQDLEGRFWELCNGGKIQYVRYSNSYNTQAFKTLIRRAMKFGYYEGVNLSLNFCNDCGNEWIEDAQECPCCGSKNFTGINRMNGYLAYSRVSVRQTDGSYRSFSRLNKPKMSEIADRKSM